MLHFSHRTLITISGLIWFAAGAWLLPKGLNYLMQASKLEGGKPWIDSFAYLVGGVETAVVALIAAGLFVGYFKGTRVLGKSAEKGAARINTLENPAPLYKMYKPAYYILLASMMGIGMGMNFFSVPLDIRGFVDVAVGSALINGSMVYFRKAFLSKALSL